MLVTRQVGLGAGTAEGKTRAGLLSLGEQGCWTDLVDEGLLQTGVKSSEEKQCTFHACRTKDLDPQGGMGLLAKWTPEQRGVC